MSGVGYPYSPPKPPRRGGCSALATCLRYSPPSEGVGEAVNHHKMLLLPMHNARQRNLAQLPEVDTHAHCLETQFLRRIADSQHAHAATGGGTHITQLWKAVCFAVVLGNHGEARSAAVHLVGLVDVRKGFHLTVNLLENIFYELG